MAGGGLLAFAALLEGLIASMHGVSVASIHEHTIVPGVVHGLAILSIPVCLVPLFSETSPVRSVWFRAVATIAVGALLLAAQTLAAALLALTVSASVLAWSRLPPRSGRHSRQ
jgi:hypothetical protein